MKTELKAEFEKARPVEALAEAPLSRSESALLLGALFALAVSLASFTTL